jgi:hypothetical protein
VVVKKPPKLSLGLLLGGVAFFGMLLLSLWGRVQLYEKAELARQLEAQLEEQQQEISSLRQEYEEGLAQGAAAQGMRPVDSEQIRVVHVRGQTE